MVVDIRDEITCFKFGDDRFRGLASAEGQILPFPIDFDSGPYNTLTLPCERVIHYESHRAVKICKVGASPHMRAILGLRFEFLAADTI